MATHETYLKEQPWITITYLTSDTEADANGGKSAANLTCCICGQRHRIEYVLPPAGDPLYATLDRERGLPEVYEKRRTFQLAHLHPDRQAHPMLQWAMPLRNIDAIGGTIDLESLAARLREGLDPAKSN